MNRLKLTNVLVICLFLMTLGVPQSQAAPVSNSDIQLGLSSSNGVGNVKVNVNASNSGVTFSYVVAGSPAVFAGPPTTGYFVAGSATVFKVSSAFSEQLFDRAGTAATDTGIVNSGATTVGAVYTSPMGYAVSAMGGYSGLAVACFQMAYYSSSLSPSQVNFWHCSDSFNWPASSQGGGQGGGQACMANGSVATLADISFSRANVLPGETYESLIGGQSIASVCSIQANNGWIRHLLNGNQIALFGPVTGITFTAAPDTNTYAALVQRILNWGGFPSLGDTYTRQYFLSAQQPTANSTPVSQMSIILGQGSGQNSPSVAGASQPKYSGPEFSSFGSATLAGNKLVTSGKKLDTITSMKLNGTAVTYKINSASELEIDLPKDLAPGKYDVEINSVHGKLTHLQGITIKAVVPTNELAFKAEGAWLNYGSLLELTNIAKQIGSEYTSVKCIVNAADPVLAERLAKRACSYLEANRLRGKAVTHESKSTYKGEGFWVRVVANG